MSKPSDYGRADFQGELIQQPDLENATFTIIDAVPLDGEFGPYYLVQIKHAGKLAKTFLRGTNILQMVGRWLADPRHGPITGTLTKKELEGGKSLWVFSDPTPEPE